VEFHSTIGATNRLGTFRINTTGVVELGGAAKAKAVSIRAAEFTVDDVDTAVVDTVTNAQTYYGVGNFLGSITSERLTVTSTADVTNVEPWRVSGVTTINTKTNADVTLLNIAASPKNVFGEVSIRGGNVVLEAEGNVNVRGMKAYNSISLNVSDILGLEGNITQTGAITADNFTATAFASITLDHTRNRIAQFTSVSAGNSLTLVSNKAGNVALDGVMHAGTGSVDLAARSGSFIYTATAEIDSALDWTMYTTVLKPTGFDLEAWFTTHGGPLSIEEGVFGVPPTAGGNVIVYRIHGA
jgi:hypothetical protein